MTDLEMTRLCAQAMGYSDVHKKGDQVYAAPFGETIPGIYWPLDNDAQAMALVKKFQLALQQSAGYAAAWTMTYISFRGETGGDLNRAICECVAKMQKAKL